MNSEIEAQLAALRAEWAKAPLMTRTMAGAYMGPLLELLETIIRRSEENRASLTAMAMEINRLQRKVSHG